MTGSSTQARYKLHILLACCMQLMSNGCAKHNLIMHRLGWRLASSEWLSQACSRRQSVKEVHAHRRARSGGLVTQLVFSGVHAGVHITIALVLMLLLELGVETCVRCDSAKDMKICYQKICQSSCKLKLKVRQESITSRHRCKRAFQSVSF